MHKDRRAFLRNTSLATGLLLFQHPFRSLAALTENASYIPGNNRELIVWHTNDLHGQMITLRPPGEQGLFLDAGDFTNGDMDVKMAIDMIRIMNKAGYHAVTIGNRELAHGQAALSALIPYMQFALVNCNYRFTDASLSRQVLPYKIVYAGTLKVGITGVGPLLPENSGVTFLPPVAAANAVAVSLKKDHGCDLVICLSHLGFDQPGIIPDSRKMARQSTHIDFVIGGHQQKMLSSTLVLRNASHKEVFLSQAGWDGKMVGKMKMMFNEARQGCGIQPGCITL